MMIAPLLLLFLLASVEGKSPSLRKKRSPQWRGYDSSSWSNRLDGDYYYDDTSSSTATCDNSVVPKYSLHSCNTAKNKYCRYGKDNTMCRFCGVNTGQCGSQICTLGITSDEDKAAIVNKHNELRRKVAKGEETQGVKGAQPPAANMNELVWDDEVAKMAQTWAEQCAATPHDTNRKMIDILRGNPRGMYCGQNVFNSYASGGGAQPYIGLETAVQKWFDEVKDFDKAGVNSYGYYGSNNGKMTGHYTQVVWGSVTKIGCGYIYRIEPDTGNYPGWYSETIVCNYCRGGNMVGSEIYKTGTAGSDCPADHPNNKDGLCSS